MIEVISQRIRSLQHALGRLTLLPLLVRCGVFGCALVSFLLAYPAEILANRIVFLLVVVAVLPAVGPRRVCPTLAVLVAVGGWLLATAGYGEPVALWRVLGLATTLYLTHSLCALAALLPSDAVVDVALLIRWSTRALAVTLVAAALGVPLIALTGSDGLTGGGVAVAAALGGLLVALGTAALLVRLLRRD